MRLAFCHPANARTKCGLIKSRLTFNREKMLHDFIATLFDTKAMKILA
jgi:hypothetical protein